MSSEKSLFTSFDNYNAQKIKVLEGLQPVRLRPGMYIGGTESKNLHHLAVEIIDNSMDEVINGFANTIEINLINHNTLKISDNGRGIPIDNHPMFPNKSALEVIMTNLHSGGKFSDENYTTSGGLHGVGVSVVNALSEKLEVEIKRGKITYKQTFNKGIPQKPTRSISSVNKRNGTTIIFSPDKEIFGNLSFIPETLYNIIQNKAYLHPGLKIKWSCVKSLINQESNVPFEKIHIYENGIKDKVLNEIKDKKILENIVFYEKIILKDEKIECAIAWLDQSEKGFINSFCNTISTPLGGTHEQGLKNALIKSIRKYAVLSNFKKSNEIIIDDIIKNMGIVISTFVKNPQFQGQTKEKLVNTEIIRKVESSLNDRIITWLANNAQISSKILNIIIENLSLRKQKKN